MRCAITGSFDPITLGHINIIERASKLFKEVFVVVLHNEEKTCMFSLEQRLELMKLALEGIENANVFAYGGMTYEFCRENKIDVIVRGIRNSLDCDYETQMAEFNRNYGVETLFLPAEINLSSTQARKAVLNKKSLTHITNEKVEDRINEFLK